jgi:transcriptional regulator GlxA family with amidase domain
VILFGNAKVIRWLVQQGCLKSQFSGHSGQFWYIRRNKQGMRSIGMIIPYDHNQLTIGAVFDVIETVNRIYASTGREKPFSITILHTPEQIQHNGRFFHGYPVKSVRSGFRADIVFIPSLAMGKIKETITRNALYIPWLHKQYRAGAEIASFCTGAFLFGASGLLDGKQATTHVDACCTFASFFPAVFIRPGQTATADGRCYTSGGATAAFHVLILLVQKYCGDETAIRISKYFAIDLDSYKQSHFSIFKPDYSHSDDLVKEIQKSIETNYCNIDTIEEVIKNIPASRRNIVRRFKHATGIPPIEYLQQIRMERAKKLLEQSNLNIAEIVADTGYKDPKSFRKIFHKVVGITPLEYRNKFKIR